MNNSLELLNSSIKNLEEALEKRLKLDCNHEITSETVKQLQEENISLKEELDKIKQEYQSLQENSKDVIKELNNSIQIIEDYFKKES